MKLQDTGAIVSPCVLRSLFRLVNSCRLGIPVKNNSFRTGTYLPRSVNRQNRPRWHEAIVIPPFAAVKSRGPKPETFHRGERWTNDSLVPPRSDLYLLYIKHDQMIDRIVKITTTVFIYLTSVGAAMLNMIDRSERYSPPGALFHIWGITRPFIHPFTAGQDNAEGIHVAILRYNKGYDLSLGRPYCPPPPPG